MEPFSIKAYAPRSLFWRAFLILIVPIVALQLVIGISFIQRHVEGVTEQMVSSVALELRYAAQMADQDPGGADPDLRTLGAALNVAMRFEPGVTVTPMADYGLIDLSGRAVVRQMQDTLGDDIAIDLLTNRRLVDIRIPMQTGALHAVVPRNRVSATNPHQLPVLMTLTALLLSLIATLFLRNQVRPIRALASAAEAFGKGRSDHFRPAGAEEVRRAGRAFLSMRSRLERQIEQRTQMLSGVSHDLRTPLTRMRLSLALLDLGPEGEDLVRDVTEMERMLDEFLAFARGDSLEETTDVDPFTLARQLADNARRAGHDMALSQFNETPENVGVPLREGAVRRALENLLGNAARYGTRTRLTVRLMARALEFVVEDNGPGIPEPDRDRATRPFTRLDPSRNQDAGGGVGLGLSITADVARSHGGALDLGVSAELGGLEAVLRFPR